MAHNKTFTRAIVLLLAIVAAMSAIAPASAEDDKGVIRRSIQELVRAQGTHCFPDVNGVCQQFAPPVANYIFFAAGATHRIAAVDYAGLEDAWLKKASDGDRSFQTKFSGTVTERPLAGGRAEINIKLRTTHEAARAFSFDGTPLFGNTTPDVLAGARAAFGDSTLDFTFINPKVGMPLPDMAQIGFDPLPGQDFVVLHFRAEATGPLHAGFGVPEGTRGRMIVDMISTAANPSAKEVLDLRVIHDD